MLSNLNHPHVLRFYGVVVESYAEPNVIGIMTEYMKGGSLSAFLRSVYRLMHASSCFITDSITFPTAASRVMLLVP